MGAYQCVCDEGFKQVSSARTILNIYIRVKKLIILQSHKNNDKVTKLSHISRQDLERIASMKMNVKTVRMEDVMTSALTHQVSC